MTTAFQIATRLLVVPLVFVSVSAIALPPTTKATRGPGMDARRVVVSVMAGSVLAFAAEAAHPADAVESPSTLNMSLPKNVSVYPTAVELVRADLQKMGVTRLAERYDTLQDKVNKGLLGPLHKRAEEAYLGGSGGQGALFVRFMTDSNHWRYKYNLKTHAFSVQFRADLDL